MKSLFLVLIFACGIAIGVVATKVYFPRVVTITEVGKIKIDDLETIQALAKMVNKVLVDKDEFDKRERELYDDLRMRKQEYWQQGYLEGWKQRGEKCQK
jgi:hypothetical protein